MNRLMMLMAVLVRLAHAAGPEETTVAAPGFLVEPTHLVTTVVHPFSEGAASTGVLEEQAVVHFRVFPPAGRTLHEVGEVNVHQAKDDQGRSLSVRPKAEAGQEASRPSGYRPQDAINGFQVELTLPLPDARAIDLVEGDVVVLTSGPWQELSLTNAQTGAQVDLSELLPEAQIEFEDLSLQESHLRVRAQVTGPLGVGQIDLQVKTASGRLLQGQVQRRPGNRDGSQVLSLYAFDPQGQELTESFRLIVRVPSDLKRERVHFAVRGLDLL